MPDVLDTNRDCSRAAECFATNGIRTVFRYYSEHTRQREKRLTASEAAALGAADLRIGVVYQDGGRDEAAFAPEKGRRAGSYAFRYARDVIRQPIDSAIYFAVDYDASAAEVNRSIIPYLTEAARAFEAESAGGPTYRIGVYGSGLVCRRALEERVARYTWVSMSRGFRETRAFLESGKWTLRQHLESELCGLSIDPDERNGDRLEIGDFVPDPSLPSAIGRATSAVVTARDGLLLRGGPGIEFGRIGSIPHRSVVYILDTRGDWALIDLAGDGAADGFCFRAFLEVDAR